MTQRLRVLELGSGVSAAYAARCLSEHHADVIKVEDSQGDRTRKRGPFAALADQSIAPLSGLYLALNINKRSVQLDFSEAAQLEQLVTLLNWADILVHNLHPRAAKTLGVDPAGIARLRSDLVVLSITPFGISGPYANYAAEELTVANAGGWANLCPSTHQDPTLPPLKVFGSQCGFMAGLAGAMTALATFRETQQSGVGDYIDLSEQAYVASVLEVGIPMFSYKGDVAARYMQRSLIPWRTFKAKDRPIFLVCVEQDQWERLVAFMGNPDWAQLEIFTDQTSRAENQDMVHTLVQEFVIQWSADDLYHEAQKHRVCVAPVLSIDQLATNEHLIARKFMESFDHPTLGSLTYIASPVINKNGRTAIKANAPDLGQHNESVFAEVDKGSTYTRTIAQTTGNPVDVQLPLAGIRVVDLTWVWAGTFGAMNLAHLGAEVIRFESAARPDLYRRLPVHPEEWQPSLNISGMFNQWNQGKASIAVDMQSPEGINIIKAFVAKSDVVIQNFATGVLERLGLSYDTLKKINPKIILASISGYGQSGPYREYMGYGPAIPPLTGLSACTGYINGEAEELGISMPDPTAGLTAAWAVVAALRQRDVTGVGDHLDISMWEATGVFAMEAWMQHELTGTLPQRQGNRDLEMSPHGCFACVDNSAQNDPDIHQPTNGDFWISIACADDKQWRSLCEVLAPELAHDKRFITLPVRKENEDELEALLTLQIKTWDRWVLTQQLQAKGIAAFPTLSCKDIVEDPHLNQRGFIERLSHPEVGARAHSGIPWRFQNRHNGVRKPAPCLGQDTTELLRIVLGYDEAHINVLAEKGILK